jgi:hypothetical protein
MYGLVQTPEKSGIDAVPWLGSCVNAADENRLMVTMANFRMIDFSCKPVACANSEEHLQVNLLMLARRRLRLPSNLRDFGTPR